MNTERTTIKDVNQQFSIVGLKILKECDPNIRKNLEPGYFFFNEWCTEKNGKLQFSDKKTPSDNFFGKNISIQAIVGKNGSGKSSILEIIYRLINNFAYYLVTNQKRPGAENLNLVENLYADLYFVKGEKREIGSLICRGNFLGFSFKENKIAFGEQNEDYNDFNFNYDPQKNDVIEIAKSFFYTIVTNYSLQSFIDTDYKIERSVKFDGNGKSGIDSSAIWINGLFHKNDGYLTPIVLNPYRDRGVIDLKKEYNLTNYRLSSILIESSQKKRQFIDGYQLNSIEYSFDPLIVFKKFEESKEKNAYYDDFVNKFLMLPENSIAKIILKEYSIDTLPSQNDAYLTACIYLVYKTISIASKYPSFIKFEHFNKINDYKKIATEADKNDLRDLVANINSDKSHITVKIRQVLKFINWIETTNEIPNHKIYDFTYNEYIKGINNNKTLKGLDQITENLPPAFFTFDIKLDKVKKDGTVVSSDPILFQRMSSGERQFIYTMTTFVYHIKNLLSIYQTNRVRYRSINLILDEVEICFHPEYQRLFLNKMITTIQRLKLNTHCSFNIIIATHSPFILSDIPMCNILYLDDGKIQNKSEFKNPFGANINDILYQSFFLENGFIGEYAKTRINKVLKLLSYPRALTEDEKDLCVEIINFIGEPIIKNQLQALYNEKVGIIDEKDKLIEELKKKLEKYKNEKNSN